MTTDPLSVAQLESWCTDTSGSVVLQVVDSLDRLLKKTKRTPSLDVEEERTLFELWRTKKDEKAKGRIIEASMRHVVSLAIMFRNYPIATEDLISEGSIGLMQAFDKFKPKMGNRFVTYASYWIKAFMYNAILAYHLETHTQGKVRSELYYRYKRERNKAENLYGKSEQAEAYLSEKLGITSTQLTKMKRVMELSDISLDIPVYDDKNTTLGATLEFDGDSPEEIASNSHQSTSIMEGVREVLQYLDKRERYIAENRLMRFHDEAKTLAEIGRDLGVSRERARQLEARAKKKLKLHLLPLRNLLAT
jgi:RNA polymerase sigma-32 factor